MKKRKIGSWFLALTLMSAPTSPGATLPSAPENLISPQPWVFERSNAGSATVACSDSAVNVRVAQQLPGEDGIVIVHELDKLSTPAAVAATIPATVPAAPGDLDVGQALHVRLWARSAKQQSLHVVLRQAHYPFAPWMHECELVQGQWKRYDFDCIAPQSKEKLCLSLKVSDSADFKEISVSKEPLAAVGIKAEDLSEIACDKRIENIRKVPVKIRITNQAGAVVKNAGLLLHQTAHEFLFGTQVQGLQADDNARWQASYQKYLSQVFNFATVTPYWPQVEVKQGQINFQAFDKQIKWLSDHGFKIEINPVFWPHWSPDFVDTNPDLAQPLIDEHTRQTALHFGGALGIHFFVNNEVVAALTNDSTSNGVVNWVRKVGAVDALERETKIERDACGTNRANVQLLYNDYVNNKQEIRILEALVTADKLPDALGVQMHMTQGNWPLAKIQLTLNELSRFGRPIYVTEISVLSGEPRIGSDRGLHGSTWPSTTYGEQQQAHYVERLYKLLYSNLCVHGISWWDFTDKNSWQGAPRGLLRADMSAKPAFERISKLICKDWCSQLVTTSGDDGEFRERVFPGDYDLNIINSQGKSTRERIKVDGRQTSALTIVISE